jgi:hypothetical protein
VRDGPLSVGEKAARDREPGQLEQRLIYLDGLGAIHEEVDGSDVPSSLVGFGRRGDEKAERRNVHALA